MILEPWMRCTKCRQNEDGSWVKCPEHSKSDRAALDLKRYIETGKASKTILNLRLAEADRVNREKEEERRVNVQKRPPCNWVFNMRYRGPLLGLEFLICGEPVRKATAKAIRRYFCEYHFRLYRK